MDERKFSRLQAITSLSAIRAWEISARDFLMPDFGFLGMVRRDRGDWSPYRSKRGRKADPIKKAARKRQKKARAMTRKAR